MYRYVNKGISYKHLKSHIYKKKKKKVGEVRVHQRTIPVLSGYASASNYQVYIKA